MRLPEPFYSAGEHLAIDLPYSRALFTTRRGGVSSGPYASLNLGRFTDDDPDAVETNRELLALVNVFITNVLNNLSISIPVQNNNVAVQICAVVQALNTILAPGELVCSVVQRQ